MSIPQTERLYDSRVEVPEVFPAPGERYTTHYPVILHVGEQPAAVLHLPLRELPGGEGAISLLMTTQSPFEVVEVLSGLLSENVAPFAPEVIVGVPSLGMPLAEGIARRLGHPHYVALTNTAKYWQDPELSVPVTSITSVGEKRLYLDQYLKDRITGRRVLIVDDVANTGGSLAAAVLLVQMAQPNDIAIAVALTEGHAWEQALSSVGFDWREKLIKLGHIPMFRRLQGGWTPQPETL